MKRQNSDVKLSQLVIHHISQYLEQSNIHRDAFVKNDLLPVLVANGLLDEPTEAAAYTRWVTSACKRISRYLSGENELKADWIFPVLSALPDDHLGKAMHELCGFFGSHFVPITPISKSVCHHEIKSTLSDVSKEFGDVLQKAAPAMDGLYNEDDSIDEMQLFANEIFELNAACFSELGKIYQATGVLPAAYQAMANSPLFKK
jgi:hypothetical protein